MNEHGTILKEGRPAIHMTPEQIQHNERLRAAGSAHAPDALEEDEMPPVNSNTTASSTSVQDTDTTAASAHVQAEPQQRPIVVHAYPLQLPPLPLVLRNKVKRTGVLNLFGDEVPPRIPKVHERWFSEPRTSKPRTYLQAKHFADVENQRLRASSELPVPRPGPDRDPPYQIYEDHEVQSGATEPAAHMRNNMMKYLFRKGKWVQYHSEPYCSGRWCSLFEPMCGNERLNQLKVYKGDVVFCEMQQMGESSGPRRFDDQAVIRIEPATPSEAEKYMIGRATVDLPSEADRYMIVGWCYRKQIYGRLIKAVMHVEEESAPSDC